jgi:hypothetical protein
MSFEQSEMSPLAEAEGVVLSGDVLAMSRSGLTLCVVWGAGSRARFGQRSYWASGLRGYRGEGEGSVVRAGRGPAKTGTTVMAIIFATVVRVEAAKGGFGPVDHKIEARDFANLREISLGLLGEYRHRVAGEGEFT